jgi:hypothetical protein
MADVKVTGPALIQEDNFMMVDNGTIATLSSQQMYEYGKSSSSFYTVKQEECVEVLKIGIAPDTDCASLLMRDDENLLWNEFTTISSEGCNTLPFNARRTFEETMMEWGYLSYLTWKNLDVNRQRQMFLAPTWKLSEGMRPDVYEYADVTGISTGSKAIMLTRRYKKGSQVDFKYFHTIDGGLKSGKKYHNDDQQLATTVASQDTLAWEYDFLKNESFKFFMMGIGALSMTNLVSGKIMIDDPEKQWMKFFCGPTFNQFPYVDTHNIDTSVSAVHQINETSLIVPTLDTSKGANKNLRVYLKDDGTPETILNVRFQGVRYST